jgi:hypothetical protein
MARHDLAQYHSFRELLGAIAGVWEGTYTHLHPNGELIERFGSRQETRLAGPFDDQNQPSGQRYDWFERILYTKADLEPEVLDFRATFDGVRMVFDDEAFHGESFLVEGRITVFPYHWKTTATDEIVEIIVLATDTYRTRLWQTFTDGKLVRLTVIEEHRIIGQEPAVWE